MIWIALSISWILHFWIGFLIGRGTKRQIIPIRDRVSVVLPTKFYENADAREDFERYLAGKRPN